MTLEVKDFKVRARPVRSGRALAPDSPEDLLANIRNAEAEIAEPFKGLTTDGRVVPDLFAIQSNGLSNEGMKRAAEALLDSLGPGQREEALFSVDSVAWRRWSNTKDSSKKQTIQVAWEIKKGYIFTAAIRKEIQQSGERA